jgi:hypothetical protein
MNEHTHAYDYATANRTYEPCIGLSGRIIKNGLLIIYRARATHPTSLDSTLFHRSYPLKPITPSKRQRPDAVELIACLAGINGLQPFKTQTVAGKRTIGDVNV